MVRQVGIRKNFTPEITPSGHRQATSYATSGNILRLLMQYGNGCKISPDQLAVKNLNPSQLKSTISNKDPKSSRLY
jgi:hypothetical protein